MKEETKKFIITLLERELKAELIQDNINLEEEEYVKDLMDAAKDFSTKECTAIDTWYIENLIEELKENDKYNK